MKTLMLLVSMVLIGLASAAPHGGQETREAILKKAISSLIEKAEDYLLEEAAVEDDNEAMLERYASLIEKAKHRQEYPLEETVEDDNDAMLERYASLIEKAKHRQEYPLEETVEDDNEAMLERYASLIEKAKH